MKKRIIALLTPLLLLSLVFIPQTAQAKTAHPHKPLYTYKNAHSNLTWAGGTYGASTEVVLSNPDVTTGSYDGDWTRELVINTSTWTVPFVAGFEKDVNTGSGSHFQYCHADNDGVQHLWFYYEYSNDGVHCYTISLTSSLINTQITLYLVDSGSTDEYVQTYAGGNTFPCSSGCDIGNTPPAWYYVQEIEHVQADVSGHMVWGSNWTANSYYHSDGTAHLQQTDGSLNPVNDPPQMFWHIKPSTTAGGNLYSCVYETGSSCTYGS